MIEILETKVRSWSSYSNNFSYDERTLVSVDDIKNLKKRCTDIVKGVSIPPKSKVYFSTSTKFPRYKFTEWGKQNGCRRVLDPSNADIIILGEEGFNNFTSWTSHVKPVKDNNHGDIYQYIERDKVDSSCREYYNMYSNIPQSVIDADVILDTFPNKVFMSENQLSQIVNTGFIINEEIFKQLSTMLGSSDVENVKLAMDMMANCDYEKSLFKLFMLRSQHYQTIYASSAKNLTNFKSLDNYLSQFGSFWEHSSGFDVLTEALDVALKRGVLMKDDLETGRQAIMEEIRRNYEGYPFDITQLQVKIRNEENYKVVETQPDTNINAVTNEPNNTTPAPTEASVV